MATVPLEKLSSNKSFEGELIKYKFKVIGSLSLLAFRELAFNTSFFLVSCSRQPGRSVQSLLATECLSSESSCSHLFGRINLYGR